MRSATRVLLCAVVFVATARAIPADMHRVVQNKEFDLTRLPIAFEENLGQFQKNIRFAAHGSGYSLFLGSKEAVLEVLENNPHDSTKQIHQFIRLTFAGASSKTKPQGLDLLPGKSNYLIGKNPEQWHQDIRQFGKVKYRSIYPGADLVYYGHEGAVEFDFHLAPGADASPITLNLEGASSLEVTEGGNILLHLVRGVIRLTKPDVYQVLNGIRHTVNSRFVLLGENSIGIRLDHYDKNSTLVIDPTLSFATLIPVNNNTQPQSIALDSQGNIFIGGTTFASDYPTKNAFQSSNGGYTDAFITKLNPTGESIVYSTYLGGSGFDGGSAVAVDQSGQAYLAGGVGSLDFPTTPGAFMTTCPSSFSCNTPFVAKFSPDGHLLYSTLTGGSNNAASGLAVDSYGGAYIVGTAASNDMPVVNAFEPNFPGFLCTSCNTAFLQKLNPDGSALVYSTYFGGTGTGGVPFTTGNGVAVDKDGDAYIVGSTASIPTHNPIQPGPGGTTAYIAKFTPDGTALSYATYFGGSGGDSAVGVAVDPLGNAHITGTSGSCDFPLSFHAFNADCSANRFDTKVFVAVLDPDGDRVVFSTFLGSGFVSAIAVDSEGDTFIDGSTAAVDFPVRKAIQASPQASLGNSNAFVSEFNLEGRLVFSTYLGGQAGAQATGIAADREHHLFVTGASQGDFPILHPLQLPTSQSCCYSFFIARIDPEDHHPEISLSPRSSPVLSLRNVSSSLLSIASITPSSNFTKGGNCVDRLAPGTVCTLVLQGAADQQTVGTVTIATNASHSPQIFKINKSPFGDNVGPLVTIAPIFINFPQQLVNTPSALQTVIISNAGLQPASITEIAVVSGDFSQTNDCPSILIPPSFCTVRVQFQPGSSFSSGGQLAIVVDQNRSTVFLRGSASNSAFAASTTYLQFPAQYTGTTSLTRVVNFTNTSPYAASLGGVSVTPGFLERSNCSTIVQPHASCRAAISFVPTSNEQLNGTLNAESFGPGGAQTVSLSATGLIQSSLSVSPITLDFPQALVGVNDNPQGINVTNISQQTVNVTSVVVSGPFSQTNTCVGALTPAASCQVNVSFLPTTPGPASGSLTINLGEGGTSQVLSLTGTATTPLTFFPSQVVFGEQRVGTASPQTFLSISNSSFTSSISLNSFQIQGDFSIAQNPCPAVLQRFFGCALQIVFTPQATGNRTGNVIISASDSSQPHVIPLKGIGVGAGVLTLSLSSLDFGTQRIHTLSAPQSVALSNTGTGPLHFSGVSASPQFQVRGNCQGTLAPGARCVLEVSFFPTLAGILDGVVTIQDDTAGSPHSISLTGISTVEFEKEDESE